MSLAVHVWVKAFLRSRAKVVWEYDHRIRILMKYFRFAVIFRSRSKIGTKLSRRVKKFSVVLPRVAPAPHQAQDLAAIFTLVPDALLR